MKHQVQTEEQLIHDLHGLHWRTAELEESETDHNRVEKALRESEEKYRSTLETIEDGYYEVDLAGNLTYFNDVMVDIHEYPRDELLGMNSRQYTDANNAKILFKAFNRVYRTGEPSKGTHYEILTKNGGRKNLESSVTLIRDSKGNPSGFRGIVRDVSELKKAQGALQDSEERYRTIIETIEDGYFEVDLAGNLTFCNEAHSRILGYTRDELIGMNNRQYMDPGNSKKVFQTFNKVFQTGSPEKGFDWELIRKDRSKIFVETSVSLIQDVNHKKIGFRGILRDITRQKQANEEINRNNDLQKVINSLLQLSMEDIILERILEKAIDVILAIPWLVLESKGAILLVEEDSGVLVMKAQRGLNKILQETCSRVPFGRCICGKAALKREIEFADRIDGRHDISYEAMIPHGHYCVPILFSNRILGVLNLYIREGHLRESKEEEFLTAMSHTLAGIIVRKRMENSLRESQDRYRDLVETSRDLISIHDLKGQILWVNEEPVKILGYEKEEVLKMSIRDIIASEHKDEFENYLKALQSQGVARGLMMIQTAKGEKRIWEYNNTLRTEGLAEPVVRSMARDVTEQKLAEREVKKTLEKLRKAMCGIIQMISQTVEMRDPYTAGHQKRVANLGRAIAQEMGIPEDKVEGLRMAGEIHDLGKISVPAEILSKPSRLSDIEFGLIKTHPQIGYDILKEIEFPWPIARMVLEHHERINGSGYPQGLKGDEILLESRILVVADVVEAIASHRPYRPAHGIDEALEEISKNKGILYDPEVVDVCLRLFKEKRLKFD